MDWGRKKEGRGQSPKNNAEVDPNLQTIHSRPHTRAIQVFSSSACVVLAHCAKDYLRELMMEDHEDDGGQRSHIKQPQPTNPRSASFRLAPSPQPPSSPYLHRSSRSHQDSSHSDDDTESSESSESDESDEEFSASTLEASTAAKQSIERYYKNFFHSLKERQDRYVRPSSSTRAEAPKQAFLTRLTPKRHFSVVPICGPPRGFCASLLQ